MKKIGIIEAAGTGMKVADIFREVIRHIAGKGPSDAVDFLSFKDEFGYCPDSFISLREKYANKGYSKLNAAIKAQVKDLKKFYLEANKKTVGLFRAAVNAETLYYLRREIRVVKVVCLPIETKAGIRKLYFIRDQIQGYYANDKLKVKKGKISSSFGFSSQNFVLLTKFIKEIIDKYKIADYELQFLYKFHLFGFELQKMIEGAVSAASLKPSGGLGIYQPDTGLHKLLSDLPNSSKAHDIILVVGNEIGDVLLETLIHYYKLGTKETLFTLNFAFIDKPKKLEVLQTIHGSADDIAGSGLLNPIATIRAAAYALENWLGVQSAVNRMENVIKRSQEAGFVVKAGGGNSTTDEVLGFIISNWK